MAKHDVSVSLPKQPLGRADIEFLVKKDGDTFGTLTISNGSVVWFPRGTSYGLKVEWTKLDKLLQESATRVEKR